MAASRTSGAPGPDASPAPGGPRRILGTAGHIDHGKTALVRALTGVDTDRLAEERARGITIELGFAELRLDDAPALGVVDVPGHEAFVRTMVAGASGMDIVLLVVAADEGAMPQTREHLAIVELLGVPEMVIALTKADLVDGEWLELVADDLRDLLRSTPYADAALVPVSATEGTGLDALRAQLAEAGRRARARRTDDLARLPVDRVFPVAGAGTVVTGTLWSGRIADGDRVRTLPGDRAARVRGVQIHGSSAPAAEAGARAAVALTGDGADRDHLERGATLVSSDAWETTSMLTTRVRVLPDTGWSVAHNQRVHALLGTHEVRARCALLEDGDLAPGGAGWVQLRLEEPVVARARDRLVLRSYSPVVTIAGAEVAEPLPPKRRRLDPPERARLEAILDGSPSAAVRAVVEGGGLAGVEVDRLPVLAGLPPAAVDDALGEVEADGALRTGARVVGSDAAGDASRRLRDALEAYHRANSLEAAAPLPALRAALPEWAAPGLADAVLASLEAEGRVEAVDGGVRAPGHRVELTADQRRTRDALASLYAEAGLAPPARAELEGLLRDPGPIDPILRHLEADGTLVPLDDGVWIDAQALAGARAEVRRLFQGRGDLGPADFREALPVTRKHLMPLLAWMDRTGVTRRDAGGRTVL